MKYAYFKGKESETFRFVQVPYLFFEDENFRKLSSDAKILFGLMLGKMSLSRKNNWLDEEDHVYIMWSQESICETLGRSKPTVIKIIKELVSAGLIEYPKSGQGNCAVIYVKDFLHEEGNVSEEKDTPKMPESTVNSEKSKVFTSRSKKTLSQEVKGLYPNYIDNSYTEQRDTTTVPSDVVAAVKGILSDYRLSDNDIESIVRASGSDVTKCREAKEQLDLQHGAIYNVTGWLISALKNNYRSLPAYKESVAVQTAKKGNYFAFEQRDTDYDTLLGSLCDS